MNWRPRKFADDLWGMLGWVGFASFTLAVIDLTFVDAIRSYPGIELLITLLLSGASFVLLRSVLAATRPRASTGSAAVDPPGLAEWLLALVVPRRRADALLGDLEERFHRNVDSRGLRRARMLYWAEALRSIGPILWMKAKQLGFLALVAEIWRRTHS
jgi:hypothetical protein